MGPLQTVTTAADFAHSVYATDLDGDGDADVLFACSFNAVWVEVSVVAGTCPKVDSDSDGLSDPRS